MSGLFYNEFICIGGPPGFILDCALLVSGDIMQWIGPVNEDPVSFSVRLWKDLKGRVVIPGLVNTHAHGGLSIHRGYCDDGDLFEWASALSHHTASMSIEDLEPGCSSAVMEMVRNGTTTACDCARYGAGVRWPSARSGGDSRGGDSLSGRSVHPL